MISALLKTSGIQIPYSLNVLRFHVESEASLYKQYVYICRDGHMVRCGAFQGSSVCKLAHFNEPIDLARRFWYTYVSCRIGGFCRTQNPFTEIMNGCCRAKEYFISAEQVVSTDYYDGDMF